MRKKKADKSVKNVKKLNIIENKIKLLEAEKFGDIDMAPQYYLMFFVDMNTVAIFKSDMSKRKKIELPFMIFRLKDLLNINFRIPQKLTDLTIEFQEENKVLTMKFQDEAVKNELGDKIKKTLKNSEALKSGPEEVYSDVELKYKIAKLLEAMNFENFKENYDYRKYLDFDYLFKYNQIYNNKSDVYTYLYNRLFMGKMAVINKKSKINREGSQHAETGIICGY